VQNQSSPVEILAPTIPANWCPTGSWADVFNNYQTLFLNNSTVNIPGLGQVTAAQIATIQQNIQSIQNQIAAFAGQTGVISSITNGLGTYAVSFPTAMPTANYQILMNFIAGSTPNTTTFNWSLAAGTQTTTGFTFYSYITATSDKITSIQWSVFSIPSV
jgi:hypothetical protein